MIHNENDQRNGILIRHNMDGQRSKKLTKLMVNETASIFLENKYGLTPCVLHDI